MRTRAAVLGTLASLGVLAAGWELGASSLAATASADSQLPAPVSSSEAEASGGSTSAAADPSTSDSSTSSTGTSAAPSTSDSGSGTDSGTTTDAASSGADGTYTGTSESTRFGNVQVAVTISGGAITEVTALQLTDKENRSVQISNRAAPILRSEVLAAQSTNVASVGGATYTSDAYLASLQSALDQAGF